MKGFTHESANRKSVEYFTPPYLFEGMGMGGEHGRMFDMDVAAPPGGVPWVPARRFVTKEEDGLIVPYEGFVWCNPPYDGDLVEQFLARMHAHGNGIALVFSRTDVGWFHRHAVPADGVLFLNKRIRFILPDGTKAGSPGAGSILVGWGVDAQYHLLLAQLNGLGEVAEFKRTRL